MRVLDAARIAPRDQSSGLVRPRFHLRAAVMATWVLVLVVLATANLGRHPVPWFDEGSHLQVPRTLVQDGVYADRSAEGFRYYVGPTTGVGPTVLLPIAAVFEVAGIGLVQARLVMAAYLLFALLAAWALTRRLHGETAALLVTALLVTAPALGVLEWGRQVLGEIPALAFLLLGTFFWARSVEQADDGWKDLTFGSLCFGLMAMTKVQFTILLGPSLVILFLVNRFYHRAISSRFVAMPLVMVAAGAALWQLVALAPVIQSGQLQETLTLAQRASSTAFLALNPWRVLSNVKAVIGPDAFAFWLLPGLLYGFFLARDRDVRGVQHAFLLIFAFVGLSWYAILSVGWPRYAFPGLAVATLFVARLLVDLISILRHAPDPRARPCWLASVCLVLVMIISMLGVHARTILGSRDDSAQRMAAYMDVTLPPTAIIESWEPEVAFLSERTFRQPPPGSLDQAVRAIWITQTGLPDYDPEHRGDAAYRPTHLLVGKFGKYTGIYASYLKRERPPLLTSVGTYDLYLLDHPASEAHP